MECESRLLWTMQRKDGEIYEGKRKILSFEQLDLNSFFIDVCVCKMGIRFEQIGQWRFDRLPIVFELKVEEM